MAVSGGCYLSRSARLVDSFLPLSEFPFAVSRVLGDFSPRASRPSVALAVKGAYCVRLSLKNVASQSSFSTEHNFSSLSTH